MLKVKGKHRNIVEYDFFPVIGKKNNQSSVSHVDQEIPTHGSMDGAGNLINLVFGVPIYLAPWPSCGGGGGGGGGGGERVASQPGIIRLPSNWDFSISIGD